MAEPSPRRVYRPDEAAAQDDPGTPVFWEAVHALAQLGQHLTYPRELLLPEPSIGVQVLELQRRAAIRTDTQLLPVLEGQLVNESS